MSERKVLNKYYPPDFDPSKIPRMKLAKNRQYTVRLMAPFNMRCKTCGEYIYKGKKFNARKEDVENETYLGIRIYRFYIKCTRCLQEISFKTDPQNTDYEIEAGATRNFMALKLAEEQARREEEELREEEANNPMKLLENRTQQSRNEIETLESLEELRDLNRRQQTIDYDSMLVPYNNVETERERLERQEREDEEFVKSVNFKGKSVGSKVVAEEIIEEIKEEPMNDGPSTSKISRPNQGATFAVPTSKATSNLAKNANLSNLVKRKQPLVLVKPRAKATEKDSTTATGSTTTPVVNALDAMKAAAPVAAFTVPDEGSSKSSGTSSIGGGLSLLAAYSDTSSSGDSN